MEIIVKSGNIEISYKCGAELSLDPACYKSSQKDRGRGFSTPHDNETLINTVKAIAAEVSGLQNKPSCLRGE